jgi:hypothetical protein
MLSEVGSSKRVVRKVCPFYSLYRDSLRRNLTNSFHISTDHGACPEILWNKEVYPKSTLLGGYDPGFLPRETPRKLVHSHQRSGMFLISTTSNTYNQVRQLRYDNIVSPTAPISSVNFTSLLESFPSSLPTSSPPKADLTSVHTILPTYLAPRAKTEQGKRTHGRGSAVSPFEDIRK